MSMIACVPNVSEGRDESVIVAIGEAISAVRAVKLLDVTSDAEHNRTVYTFVGPQSALQKAVDAMIGVAIQRIDMRKHKGLHPRIGSVDVIPFIPLYKMPMEKAIKLANQTAKLVAEHYHIPVYMYDFAAKTEDRRSIRLIREGEFEGFGEKIKQPEWKPDYGPDRIHASAGVIAVGARYPLVAFNALIRTREQSVVTGIAERLVSDHFDPRLVKAAITRSRSFSISESGLSSSTTGVGRICLLFI
ncbi:MAG: glutamate formimidoyltransferase [Holophagales bacterium]|nr:glutamate formimidoyltransferase [Holophagales bacterium]